MAILDRFYLRHQVTPYVILFVERDGSTYLTSILQAHPAIAARYETFAVLEQQDASAREQLRWAREFLTPPLVGRKAASGFKTKLVDVLDQNGFAQLLQEKQVKIIHMQRMNRIKAVVSRINAFRLHEATGKWNLYDESERRPPMEIDVEEFHTLVKEREDAEEELEAYVRGLQLPTMRVRYEDLQLDKDGVVRDVLAFLEVPHMTLKGRSKKHTKDNLREVIINFDELRASFAGTGYVEMFDEVLAPSG